MGFLELNPPSPLPFFKDEGKAENFTLVFQPKESAALIEEFGETINIDATCQTNMHGLPMFLVCTNTTQGYRVSRNTVFTSTSF